MAILFKHYKTKEVLVADSEPKIAALYNSSNKGLNALVGQDHGWRIAPEVVIEMRRILRNPDKMLDIAKRYGKPLDEIGETDILTYLSDITPVESAPMVEDGDYDDEYNAEIARLEAGDMAQTTINPLDDAISEAIELGIDVEKYNNNLGFIKSAITRHKKKNNL